MGASGSFPIDLVLFGMIAAFLVLRLRSILGKRTGFERPAPPLQPVQPRTPAAPVIEGQAEPAPSAPAATHCAGCRQRRRRRRWPRCAASTAISIRPASSPAWTRRSASSSAAFAAGDRAALRPLLGDDTYAAFDQAITAREKAGETQVSDIKSIQSIDIDRRLAARPHRQMTVRIASDQISYTTDKDGRPITGTDAVTEIIDLWTFERDLSQQDPTWRLVAAAQRLTTASGRCERVHDLSGTKPRVALFVTCLVDLHRPSVGFAAIKLLEQAGCRVEVPRAQTCCGQPAYNSGDRRDRAGSGAGDRRRRSAAMTMSSCRRAPAPAC